MVNILSAQEWVKVNPTFFKSDTLLDNTRMSFGNAKVGWLATSGYTKVDYQNYRTRLFRTSDGGLSWNLIGVDSVNYASYSVFSIDTTHCWFVSANGKIRYTRDGGFTWDTSSIPINEDIETPGKILFFDKNYGLAVSSNVWRTVDGGLSWNKISDVKTVSPWNIFFINKKVGWKVSMFSPTVIDGGSIAFTSDSGKTWIYQKDRGAEFTGIAFIDMNTGFAVGKVPFGGCVIYKTTNGGVDWNYMQIIAKEVFYNISFFSHSMGVIICSDGKVWNTFDGCNSWKVDTFATVNAFTQIQFMSQYNIGYLSGGGSHFEIYKKDFSSLSVKYHRFIVSFDEKILIYPNPFNNAFIFRIELLNSDFYSVDIYDILGRKIKNVVNAELNSGVNEVNVNMSSYSSGHYFIITSSHLSKTQISKIVFVK